MSKDSVKRSDHLFCDIPGCGAVASLERDPWVRGWETLTGDDVPDAHLCPRCAEKRAAGVLAEPFYLVCARCGRSTIDGVAKWWGVPADEEARDTPPGTRPRQINVCDDCKREDDSFRI